MTEAIYCFDTASVRFAIHPEGPDGERCIVEIAEDPLRDLFGARQLAATEPYPGLGQLLEHQKQLQGGGLHGADFTSGRPRRP